MRLSNYRSVTEGYLAPPRPDCMRLLLLTIRVVVREIVIMSESRGRGDVLTSFQSAVYNLLFERTLVLIGVEETLHFTVLNSPQAVAGVQYKRHSMDCSGPTNCSTVHYSGIECQFCWCFVTAFKVQ